MKDSLILQHENYISAKRVHELFGYTSDYVGQLCRSGKLECKMIGRSWFVTEKSVIEHKSTVVEILKNKGKKKVEVSNQVENINNFIETKVVENVPVSFTEPTQMVAEISPVVISEVLASPVSQVIIEEAIPFSETLEPMKVSFDTTHPVTSVPSSFAMPLYFSNDFISAPKYFPSTATSFALPSLKNTISVVGVLVIAFVFIFNSTFISNKILNIGNTEAVSEASVLSVSKEIVDGLFSFFRAIPKLAVSSFGNLFNKNSVVTKIDKPPPEWNGLAVVQSSDSKVGDEIIKQKIRDSFSDEVVVRPDDSGTAGVITPVFRKAKGDDFVYVLVPVKN